MSKHIKQFSRNHIRSRIESSKDLFDECSDLLFYALLSKNHLIAEFKKIYVEASNTNDMIQDKHLTDEHLQDLYYFLIDNYHKMILAKVCQSKYEPEWTHPLDPDKPHPHAPIIGSPSSWFKLLELSKILNVAPFMYKEESQKVIDDIFES